MGEALDLLRTNNQQVLDYLGCLNRLQVWMLSWTGNRRGRSTNACHASVVLHEDVGSDDDAKTTRRDTLVDDSAGDRIDRVPSAAAVVVVAAARVSGNFSRAFQR